MPTTSDSRLVLYDFLMYFIIEYGLSFSRLGSTVIQFVWEVIFKNSVDLIEIPGEPSEDIMTTLFNYAIMTIE